MTDTQKPLREFEKLLEVPFADPNMLRRALTHRSFVNEVEDDIKDNERLEFLGDAVLDVIVADMLFRRFPDVSEGELTQLRAALVRTDSLAMLAQDLRLGDYLLMGKGEENNGGRTRSNNLCRGFEALIGAMYMDRGVDVVRNFVLPRLHELLDYILENDLHKDARSMLQERSQAELNITPQYRLVDSAGPDHEKEFLIEVLIGNAVIDSGIGTSKRSAAQAAARNALKHVEIDGWSDEAYDEAERIEQERAQRQAKAADSEAAADDENSEDASSILNARLAAHRASLETKRSVDAPDDDASDD